MSTQDTVFLAVPCYNGTIGINTATSIMSATERPAKVVMHGSSLLAHGFNQLWCKACTSGATIWAMLHADIGADPGWVDTLIDEMDEHGADIMSAVVPIKDQSEQYSTCLIHADTPAAYRLTQEHLDELPVTFDGDGLRRVSGEGGFLGINTGCWVCRLNTSWFDKIAFQVRTTIGWQGDLPTPVVISEDWDFSLQAAELGLKVMATKAVGITHTGQHDWTANA